MRYVSLLGDWPSHAAVGLVLLGLAWRRGSEAWTRIFLAMLLAMMLAGVAGTVIKRTVPRARPSVHAETRWGGPHFSSKYHSFPSGHVGASTAFFGVLLIARRRIGLCHASQSRSSYPESQGCISARITYPTSFPQRFWGTLCAFVVVHFLFLPIGDRQSKIEN